MQRRDFLATIAATGALSILDPTYLAAKEALSTEKGSEQPVPRRRYGQHNDELSIIGFGGIAVKDVTPGVVLRINGTNGKISASSGFRSSRNSFWRRSA